MLGVWIGLGLIVAAGCWLVLLVVGPMVVSRIGRVGPPQIDPVAALAGRLPKVSVLVAARNEAAGIGQRLDNLFALECPPGGLELVFVSDGSTDETVAILQAKAAACPPDRSVVVIDQQPNRGKEVALGLAAARATGDIFALTDATTDWRPNVLHKLIAALSQPGVGAASGRVVYREAEGAVAEAFVAYQHFVVAQRRGGRLIQVSTSGACAAAWAVCFDRYEPTVNSDLQLALLAAEKGLGTAYANDAIALEDTRATLDEELRARMRIARRCLVSGPPLVARLLRAGALWNLLQLALQKWTRWGIWVPALMALIGHVVLAVSATGWLQWAAFAGLITMALAALLGWQRVRGHLAWLGKAGDALGYLVVAVVATFRAAVQIARGQTTLAWQPDRVAAPPAPRSSP